MSEEPHPRESVYNCLDKEEARASRPPRYVSKYRPTVVQEVKSVKKPMKTMGPAEVDVPSPGKYLKKHSKEPKPSETAPSHGAPKDCTCTLRKPAVPARGEIPLMGIHTERNLTKTTIGLPTKPQPACVDSPKGHKEILENSGLVPKYIQKKNYGEIPEYLQRRHKAEQRAQEEYQNFVREQKEQVSMTHLTEEQRQAMLQGLKTQWDNLLGEYQGLSLVIDTLSEKRHKQQLEEAMDQLEKDIDLLERFKTIYIPKN